MAAPKRTVAFVRPILSNYVFILLRTMNHYNIMQYRPNHKHPNSNTRSEFPGNCYYCVSECGCLSLSLGYKFIFWISFVPYSDVAFSGHCKHRSKGKWIEKRKKAITDWVRKKIDSPVMAIFGGTVLVYLGQMFRLLFIVLTSNNLHRNIFFAHSITWPVFCCCFCVRFRCPSTTRNRTHSLIITFRVGLLFSFPDKSINRISALSFLLPLFSKLYVESPLFLPWCTHTLFYGTMSSPLAATNLIVSCECICVFAKFIHLTHPP